MLKTLVFEYRIVPFEYFMNEMGITEATLCFDYIDYTDLTMKQLMRYNIWSMYNSNALAKNKNSLEDIMKLPWDKGNTNHTVATKSDMIEQKERMKKMEDMLKNTKITEEKYM